MKNDNKLILICTMLGFGAFLTLFLFYASISPDPFLSRSEAELRGIILELTPIGMSKEDVIWVNENNPYWHVEEWGIGRGAGSNWISYNSGLRRPNCTNVVGVTSISVMLGIYRPFLTCFTRVGVWAMWGFDEDGNLIDVDVSKGGIFVF